MVKLKRGKVLAVNHEYWMALCLEKAASYIGTVAPNPMVGACLVRGDSLISLGAHEYCGGPHAEANAITGEITPDTTLYVTLEPCNHYGKTPPCTELIIAQGIKQVVVACSDPNPLVSGEGIKKLRAAGIVVTEDILKNKAQFLNRRFFTYHQKKRPYIILKWAQTADRFIARSDYSSKWISSLESRTLVHQWRSEEQAILVGTNTARYDDPSLTVRHTNGRNPLRLVIDLHNSLPPARNLWSNEAPTICFTFRQRERYGAEEICLIPEGELIWPPIFKALHQRGIISVIIEGGAAIINSLLRENLWDEARVFQSEQLFGTGVAAPQFKNPTETYHQKISASGSDTLRIIFNAEQQDSST